MSRLFVSYRRADSPDTTGRIYDLLAHHFGESNLFRDIDNIPPGEDFRESISASLQTCDVVLAVIGREWLHLKNDEEKRRLDDPDDTLRIELEIGLERDIHVIPVLINQASMPNQNVLPDSLKKLAYRNSVSIRPEPYFNTDVNHLISHLEQILNNNESIFRRFLAHLYSFKIPYFILLILLLLTSWFLPYPPKTDGELTPSVETLTIIAKKLGILGGPVIASAQLLTTPPYLDGKWKGKIQSRMISYDVELTVRENDIIILEESAYGTCAYRLNITSVHNSSATFNASLTDPPQDNCINSARITLSKSDDFHIDYHSLDPLGIISIKGRLIKVEPKIR